jgi:cellobiose PTS system EIIC component
MSVMIERASDWFERYLVPPLGALASNVYLQAVRDAFIIFTLPLVLAGSVFLVAANPPPIPGLQALVAPYQDAILVPFELSFGIMALFLAFGVA